MGEEFETVEIEYSEDDILYHLFDEEGNEIGFVIEEDGQEVECYYELDDEADAEAVGVVETLAELDGEVVEMEIDEDAIDRYLVDEDGNEVGFVIVEDGVEVECYYQDDGGDECPEGDGGGDGAGATGSAPAASPEAEEPVEHGYLYKMAQIAGHTGNKARKKAGAELSRARDKAAPAVDRARTKAEAGIDRATEAMESGGKRLKEKKDEYDLGITREDVAEATSDLNAIAKEGAETAKELKEAYDDIMDSFGFLMPKGIRRKLP